MVAIACSALPTRNQQQATDNQQSVTSSFRIPLCLRASVVGFKNF